MDDPAELDRLAFAFFKEFTRCEYSLKMAGLLTGGNRDPGANWSQLAEEIQNTLENPTSLALRDAVAYYFQSPPRKQVLKNGLLNWDDVPPSHKSKAELLLLLVCRVRNNLFHGGKFNGHWFAPQRSTELLSYGLEILAASVEAHPKVKEAYALLSDRADR